MVVLSGKNLSEKINSQTASKCAEFEKKFGRMPSLVVILIGNDPASQTYVRNKRKTCEKLGIKHFDITLPSSTSQKELIDCISSLNLDDRVDGILVQMPLPKHIDENAVTQAILPEKDVDGFHPQNIGKLLLGQTGLIACTPKGILRILDEYNIETSGKNVCVIGRSNIVGKPVAALLMQKGRDATVTVCHSRTPNLEEICKMADIVIAAVGRVDTVTADMVKEGAVVIDVGINRIPDDSKKSGFSLKGDVDYENVQKKVSAITPVPGGVGPMTIAMLMENTFLAACHRMKVDPTALTEVG